MKQLIKKWFKLVDERDFDQALSCIGNATDRPDFEWKLRMKLFRGEQMTDKTYELAFLEREKEREG